MKRSISLLFLSLLLGQAQALAVPNPIHVVASFSILADMAQTIGGDAVTVTSLVGPDADTHAYQPTPEDAKALTHADLILINGLGFEGWMPRLIQASDAHAPVVAASRDVKDLLTTSPQGAPDPHAWQDVANARLYARTIAGALEAAAPEQAREISARAAAYDAQLRQLDQFVKSQFAAIPAAKKKIITDHNAFAYFEAAYGVRLLVPLALNGEAEPSAADLARLIGQIKTQNIKRIFLENQINPRLIEQIAHDSGADIGGTLYADALSKADGPAPTYIAMFRHNVGLLKAAMEMN